MFSCSVITFTLSPPTPSTPPLNLLFVSCSTLDSVVAVATHSPRGPGVGSGPDGGSRLRPRP